MNCFIHHCHPVPCALARPPMVDRGVSGRVGGTGDGAGAAAVRNGSGVGRAVAVGAG